MKPWLLLFFLFPLQLQAGGLAWSLPPGPLQPGRPFTATLSLTRPWGSKLLPPPLPLNLPGLQILQRSARPQHITASGELLAVDYSLLALEAGEFALPALQSPLGEVEEVRIQVQGNPLAPTPLPGAPLSPWGLLPLTLLPLVWLWRPRALAPTAPPQANPQAEIAQALAACRNLAELGQGPELYQVLSPLVRRLLEEGYGLSAKGKTTEELAQGGMQGLGAWEQDDLQAFLRFSDLVNYAQALPKPEPAQAVIQALEHLNRHAPNWETERHES